MAGVLWLMAGLGAGPVRADIVVVGGLSRESIVKSGGKAEGQILLQNTGDRDLQARIYQTDYQFQSDGRNDYGEPGSAPRSNAKWLTVAPGQVTVPAHGRETVFYTVQVPDDKALVGSYWSMVMVEPIAPEALEPPKSNKPQVGIVTVTRYGIQLVTQIGDSGKRAMRFVAKGLERDAEGRRTFTVDMENTGERLLVPESWAEVYDQGGQLVGKIKSGKFRIYPECSVRQQFDLSTVPGGKYKIIVLADNGDDYVFGGQYSVTVP